VPPGWLFLADLPTICKPTAKLRAGV
jgi:hypothetical protein